jgi:hypothetical protein
MPRALRVGAAIEDAGENEIADGVGAGQTMDDGRTDSAKTKKRNS